MMGGVTSRSGTGWLIRSPSMPRSAFPSARIARRSIMFGSPSAALDGVVMAMCLDDLPWSDIVLIAVIIAVAVLWKSVEAFLEE